MIARVMPTNHVPVKLWTGDAEVAALQQLRNTAGLPCVFKHVAAMPDVHFGIGATVGSVVTLNLVRSPSADCQRERARGVACRSCQVTGRGLEVAPA